MLVGQTFTRRGFQFLTGLTRSDFSITHHFHGPCGGGDRTTPVLPERCPLTGSRRNTGRGAGVTLIEQHVVPDNHDISQRIDGRHCYAPFLDAADPLRPFVTRFQPINFILGRFSITTFSPNLVSPLRNLGIHFEFLKRKALIAHHDRRHFLTGGLGPLKVHFSLQNTLLKKVIERWVRPLDCQRG